jgi:succinate dehydrogenase / fumarate reductase, cytochrome b subunit
MSIILFSSISKKIVMALAGLFLITFLPVHLSINLMLLDSDPVPFNTAAHFMATFPLVRIMEVVLFATIFIHIGWGIFIQIQNWLARPIGYVEVNKAETSFFSRFMIWTGATILTFFVLHWFNFYFVKIGLVPGDPENFYDTAHRLFKIPAYDIIYLTCFTVLGFHLYHAFFSGLQTLGLRNRWWSPVIKTFAVIYAIVIPSGFALIAITLWLFR